MPKYVKKKVLKNAIDCCTWYHINKNGELVEGANPAEHEPLYKYLDIKKIIKGLPTRKFDDELQTSGMVWTEDAIKNEPKSYTIWTSTDESQTMDMFVIDMAIAKCKAQHNNCRNCDKKYMWRDEP